MGKHYKDLFIRRCNDDDLKDIMDLQELIFAKLPNKSILRKNDSKMFRLALAPKNLSIGVFDGKSLIAIGMCVDPDPPETDLRNNLKNPVDKNKTMDFKLVLVHNDYRGGFQKTIMWLLERAAFNKGYKYLCTSVSPDNSHSRKNIEDMGYCFDHQETLYEGDLLRNVYVKEINCSDYMDRINSVVSGYKGTPYSPLDIDWTNYIPGDISLSLYGDIVECVKKETGECVFGIITKPHAQSAVLPNEENCWEEVLFTSGTSELFSIKNVWVNTTKNIPSSIGS